MARNTKDKQVNQIKFEYKGVKYVLEYDRESAMQAEKMFDISIGDVRDLKISAFDGLFKGAFLKHHSTVDQDLVEEIMGCFSNKVELFKNLAAMFGDCVTSLLAEPDEGNAIRWTEA